MRARTESYVRLACAMLIGPMAMGLVAANPSRADMILSDVIVDLQAPEEMRYDIEVWNSGAEPLYVEIEATEVLEPAKDGSARRELDDPREAGLLVSPKRLVVSPDERKRVRMVARTAPTKEDLVYRVAFIPKENTTRTTQELAFKVLVGYEVLVLIRPPGARPELVVKREGNHFHVENRGVTNILLRKLEYCPDEKASEAECEELKGNRLYAGESWDLELPGSGPLRVFQSYRTENSVKEY